MPPSRRLAPLLTVMALVLGGCAGGPGTVDSSGVDGLEIPTPTPDSGDFVEGIDNPYLPLRPGAEWVYEASGQPGGAVTVTVTVTEATRDVAGVATTAVQEVASDGDDEVIETVTRWFAQDRAGNVWAFGEDGLWEAGLDGAQAGLAMAASPRRGDGYEQELASGVAEDRATVLAVDETRETGAGSFSDLVVIEQTTPLDPGLVEQAYYARGTGLVLLETLSGGEASLELVSVTRP